MSSIYNIPDWNTPSGSTYEKNDIVKHSGSYWYAKQDVPASQTPAEGSAYWDGVRTLALTTHSESPTGTRPYFFWKPSYGVQVSNTPRAKSIRFGDGYEQRFRDGINNNLLILSISFDSVEEKEATAISHFLDDKGGVDDFFYLPPSPHQVLSKFICREWQTVFNFDNNFSVSATFEQVP